MGPLAHSLSLLTAIGLAPLLAAALVVRPSLRHGLSERFGGAPGGLPRLAAGDAAENGAEDAAGRDGDESARIVSGAPAPPIWVHASSVGEAKAALRLLRTLEASGHALRVSTSTRPGRGVLRQAWPELASQLAPFDHPWAVERAIRRVRPRLSVLIETELWPSWIAGCARHGIPVVVASGRLSDRSFPRYRRLRRLIAPSLRRLERVGARTQLDAERFVALGVPEARVEVTGDLKLDPPSDRPALSIDLIRALSEVPVMVGGSTHPGEEEALLDALAAAEKAGHGFALVLAPREIGRAAELERLVRGRRRRVVRRSRLEGRHLLPGEVLVLDELGELSAIYATAQLAFVGGTLVPVGGHNLVEPVHAGCPVLFGPHCENVRKVVEILAVGDAGRRIDSPAALCEEVVALFADPEAGRLRGEIGRQTLEAHRGSVEQTVRLIESVLTATERGDDPERAGSGRA